MFGEELSEGCEGLRAQRWRVFFVFIVVVVSSSIQRVVFHFVFAVAEAEADELPVAVPVKESLKLEASPSIKGVNSIKVWAKIADKQK